ncbi:hypothetical protein BSLG_009036 [Batrachochytrium salamandrivorans]|nr:hypothetical protein BASA60_008549 [Batrachochytrium salamandrivorans]KAH6570947.1 hypothetical protein BASA62_004113 [Batrachochytrium salamandrivorans]KAH9268718.1 hypothetical protein BASA83_009201 [Batrachochytrium salamandrivorans]KAJ1332103.1 hypothetical protein BSLG_009036 [Batrachochytrium salamandrivorans]
MTTTTTTTPAPLKRQSLIHQHRLIKRQPQGKPPSAATTVIAPISRGGAASPSHTTSPTTATDPALPAPIVNVGNALPALATTLLDPPRGSPTAAMPTDASIASLNAQSANPFYPYIVGGIFVCVVLFSAIGAFVYNKYHRREDRDAAKGHPTASLADSSTDHHHHADYHHHDGRAGHAGHAPHPQYATYETLGRRGGPGVIEHRQEYIFQDEQDLMEATTDSEGNSAKKFATYETLGRPGGPGLLEYKNEYRLADPFYPPASSPALPTRAALQKPSYSGSKYLG